ncbi:LOW QUALITY PROTEIN: Gag protein [Phytophthora palmivora]|uniref:Gag protein n=1 Tax=Phytophthora palmivora TaxID=4796 RepID=A0A2P4YLM3_9STRA|nr:LOW QUALITY PROTEIN: Gag protein [Phytophthora palmivora]
MKGRRERTNLRFWVREVELAMDAALISTERRRVAFALFNLGAHARGDVTGLFHNLVSAVSAASAVLEPPSSRRTTSIASTCASFARKQGMRELHEYIQEMRVLAASLVGNPLPEHIKGTVFMDGLKLFRVHAETMEEAIQIALPEEYSHRQARTPTPVWQGHNASTGAVQGAPVAGASTGPVPMELGTATVARNDDKYADAVRESEGRDQVSVRLADGTVINVPGVRMDLAVKFEDLDSCSLS